MEDNNSELNPSYLDIEEPTDDELNAFVPEAEEIYKEATLLDLDQEARRIRHMEEIFEAIQNSPKLSRKLNDISYIKGMLLGSKA